MESEKFNMLFFNPALLNEQTAEELGELVKTYPWFQLAWVLYAKNLKLINSPAYETVLKKAAVSVSNRKSFFNFLNSESTSVGFPLEKESSFSPLKVNDDKIPTSSDSLIDRFLSSTTNSIRRNSLHEVSSEPNSHNDILERSTFEDDELITETLANIYLQQKNYEKAIQAFEKLSLKYPEKSIYFATRIKETKDLKNI